MDISLHALAAASGPYEPRFRAKDPISALTHFVGFLAAIAATFPLLVRASCAGCTRATGLCLNMLGIPYEHVNENQWSHQWCRVKMDDGSYWICDAYGLYCGPEPAPYQHPYF